MGQHNYGSDKFEITGEIRAPKQGEWYLRSDLPNPLQAQHDFPIDTKFAILRKRAFVINIPNQQNLGDSVSHSLRDMTEQKND